MVIVVGNKHNYQQEIVVPYNTFSRIEQGKIVYMHYFYDILNIAQSQGFTLTPPKE